MLVKRMALVRCGNCSWFEDDGGDVRIVRPINVMVMSFNEDSGARDAGCVFCLVALQKCIPGHRLACENILDRVWGATRLYHSGTTGMFMVRTVNSPHD